MNSPGWQEEYKIFHAREMRFYSGFLFFLKTREPLITKNHFFMKRFKLGFLALVSILGIGSAFTSTHHSGRPLTNYYSTSDGHGGWTWVTLNSIPAGEECEPTSIKTLCTVTTSSQPANNTIPSGFTENGHMFQ